MEMKRQRQKLIFFIPRMGNGGAERVIATLANELVMKNYEILILTLTTSESFYTLDDRVEIIGANYQISKKNKFKRTLDILVNGIKSFSFLKKKIKQWQPNVVVSFLTHTNLIAIITKIFTSNFNLIVSERAEPKARGPIFRFLTKHLYPKADYLVCQSQVVSEYFSINDNSNITVIENPIDESSIANTVPIRRKKVIVGVGRLFEQKNFKLLIDSFWDISEQFPEYTLEIYGEGHLRAQLEQQINDLKLQDKVKLMGVKKNVMKHVSDSEVFVMSSNFEGFPNALVEAMASGLPVISTDFSTGIAQDLIGPQNGLIVPVGDRISLSKALKIILSDEESRKIMAIENRKIKNTLSVDKILNKWINLFEKF